MLFRSQKILYIENAKNSKIIIKYSDKLSLAFTTSSSSKKIIKLILRENIIPEEQWRAPNFAPNIYFVFPNSPSSRNKTPHHSEYSTYLRKFDKLQEMVGRFLSNSKIKIPHFSSQHGAWNRWRNPEFPCISHLNFVSSRAQS